MAQLRHDHPGAREEMLEMLIDWPSLRKIDETYESYMSRIYGPMEPQS